MSSIRFPRTISLLMLLAALLVAAGPASADVYIVDSLNNLALLDVDSGQVAFVSSLQAQFTDIAAATNGQVYGVTPQYLYEIDVETGWCTLLGDHGLGDPADHYGLDALAFAGDGTLYGAGNNALFTFDIATATATAVGHLSGYRSAGDLTADPDGRLLLTTDAGRLVEAHADGSGATPIGDLPYNDVWAMATAADGAIYGVRSTNVLLTIDPATGQATTVTPLSADFTLGYVWGAAIPPAHSPEPATLILLAAGATVLMRRR